MSPPLIFVVKLASSTNAVKIVKKKLSNCQSVVGIILHRMQQKYLLYRM